MSLSNWNNRHHIVSYTEMYVSRITLKDSLGISDMYTSPSGIVFKRLHQTFQDPIKRRHSTQYAYNRNGNDEYEISMHVFTRTEIGVLFEVYCNVVTALPMATYKAVADTDW